MQFSFKVKAWSGFCVFFFFFFSDLINLLSPIGDLASSGILEYTTYLYFPSRRDTEDEEEDGGSSESTG